MTCNLFTAGAAALLASSAFLASLEDAEARGAGRAGGVHRMSNPVRHANISRGGAVHVGLGARASHVGRVQRGSQVSRGLHGGQTMRHGGNLRQLSRRSPTLNRNPLNSRNNLPALNNQAGSSVRSANLTPGPRSMQNRPQGRMYANMGMGMGGNTNAPQQPANNIPAGQDSKGKQNQPQHNQGQAIITNWKNTFVRNLNPKNIYDVGQSGKFPIGTAFSLCLNAAACAAGAPPAVVEVITAPLPAVTTSALEAGVNAFTPIDPKDPLSTPVDIGAKKATLNIPNAVKQQLGGNLPPAWGDLK